MIEHTLACKKTQEKIVNTRESHLNLNVVILKYFSSSNNKHFKVLKFLDETSTTNYYQRNFISGDGQCEFQLREEDAV